MKPLNKHISIQAKKSLGQNFLIDESTLWNISHATEVAGKNIIEVGPGYGALTEFLIEQNPKKLELIELDNDMIKILQERMQTEWKNFSNILLHHQDVLDFIPQENNYSVIANIPYYITSPILFHFLYPWLHNHTFQPPENMIILMQKEVGEKILAKKGKKYQYSYLSLAMHSACESIEQICDVDKTAFLPAPKVDSIVLSFSSKKFRDFAQEKKLLHLWNQAFAQPRKTLVSNLKTAGFSTEKIYNILQELGYSPSVRAEAIRLPDWDKIHNLYEK